MWRLEFRSPGPHKCQVGRLARLPSQSMMLLRSANDHQESTPFYVQTALPCAWFICLSPNGPLAAVNAYIQVTVWVCVFVLLGILRRVTLGHRVLWHFREEPNYFVNSSATHILISSVLALWSPLVISRLYYIFQLVNGKWKFYCGFGSLFSSEWQFWTFLIFLDGHLYIYFGENNCLN